MSKATTQYFLLCFPSLEQDFLLRVLFVFQDLISKNDFPPDWTTMRMITNKWVSRVSRNNKITKAKIHGSH